jgi:hypothetical protein
MAQIHIVGGSFFVDESQRGKFRRMLIKKVEVAKVYISFVNTFFQHDEKHGFVAVAHFINAKGRDNIIKYTMKKDGTWIEL